MRPGGSRNYLFSALGAPFNIPLREESIIRWIPGALSFRDGNKPRHLTGRPIAGQIDLSEAIHRSTFYEQRIINISTYIDCLRRLSSVLHTAEKREACWITRERGM